jgi:membrane associated rhomboid family serine protease
VSADRERIFNIPAVVSFLILVLALVQLTLERAPADVSRFIFVELALMPARLSYYFAPDAVVKAISSSVSEGAEPETIGVVLNGAGPAWWTLLTYALLHNGWTHLSVNCITLAAFGSPVARRFGLARFVIFFALCAVGGAIVHMLVHPLDLTPVVGASAAISGTMAAVARFAFTPGSALADRSEAFPVEAFQDTSLKRMASNHRAMFFLAAWFGVNLLFGFFPQAAGSGNNLIAWEAHMGGFLAGLLLFGLFDPRPSSSRGGGL